MYDIGADDPELEAIVIFDDKYICKDNNSYLKGYVDFSFGQVE